MLPGEPRAGGGAVALARLAFGEGLPVGQLPKHHDAVALTEGDRAQHATVEFMVTNPCREGLITNRKRRRTCGRIDLGTDAKCPTEITRANKSLAWSQTQSKDLDRVSLRNWHLKG